MPNKMLIDASHPEETRVVVTRGNRIEEFDFESQDKKQLKGNIYLARVTRVEPSLQAAFVEYGGNRHGFLAFSEIHPDYYQIPVADRQALLRAEAEDAENEDDDEAEAEERGRGRRRRRGGRNRGRDDRQAASAEGDVEASDAEADAEASDDEAAEVDSAAAVEVETDGPIAANADAAVSDGDIEHGGVVEPVAEPDEADAHAASAPADEHTEPVNRTGEVETTADDHRPAAAVDAAEDEPSRKAERLAEDETSEDETSEDEAPGRPASMAAAVDADVVSAPVEAAEELKESAAEGTTAETEDRGTVEEVPGSHADDGEVESVGAEDALEEIRNRRRPVRRNYKIQEVIKRRQILLVQVVKEERGNKGAALTTYLSLAGRYSVLMPNTARGGGISRKITNAQDRKRLKEVVADLEVPQGMGVILRTAGESRTKAEIKRDYEYLMRLWETVRNLTLQSTAPALVYEEGSLIKRSVRDLYNKDIDEILVSGEEGYREAKDFMRMLMPSHAKVVQPYRDTVPIFARAGIEAQLDRMLQPQVTLKSGGYIIINQTEALVSIDVNSGRSTKEHSIEDTALQTNLEAAEEVARQLRLRDLAGLIVIDFIDMEENRNNRSVEKRMKDCLKNDRARIQVGRISHFGLLEMSRQRIRASVLESTMKPCPHCGGSGHVRSDSSVALHVVRAIEEFLLKDSRNHITVKTPTATALYVLNHKRSTLVEMERRFGVAISLEADETLGAQPYAIVRGAFAEKPVSPQAEQVPAVPFASEEEEEIEVDIVESEDEETAEASGQERNGHGEPHHRDRKRRRRRRRRGGEREHDHEHEQHAANEEAALDHDAVRTSDEAEESEGAAGAVETATDGDHGEAGQKKRRRGKRGGRRNRNDNGAAESTQEAGAADEAAGEARGDAADDAVEQLSAVDTEVEVEHQEALSGDDVPAEEPEPIEAEPPLAEPVVAAEQPAANGEDEAAPVHRTRRRPGSEIATEPVVVSSGGEEQSKPKKGGWWQRKGFF